MRPRICICCGEPMSETGNAFSRNPNMCSSCSSMADGMGDEIASPEQDPTITEARGRENAPLTPSPEKVRADE